MVKTIERHRFIPSVTKKLVIHSGKLPLIRKIKTSQPPKHNGKATAKKPTKKTVSQNTSNPTPALPYGIRPVFRSSQSQAFVSSRPVWLQYFIDVLALALIISIVMKLLGV